MTGKYKLRDIIRVSFSLAKVNFRLRIEGNYLGIFWYLLSPLALFAVLLFVKETAFSSIDIPYYPLYLLIGIAGFNFFKQAITGAISAISANPDYLKSISRIAPESLIVAVVIQAVFSHLFELILIIAFALYFQISLAGFLLYPLVFALFFFMTLGIAFIFATVGVHINDLDNLWVIASQLLLLASPIFYSINPGSPIYQANLANPLFYFLEISRSLIIDGRAPALGLTGMMILLSLLFLAVGIAIFESYKKRFAELL